MQEGFLCENLGFISNGFSGVTGAAVYGVNRWQFVNCTFTGNSGTPMGTGLYTSRDTLGGTAVDDNSWWNVDRCDFRYYSMGANIVPMAGGVTGTNFVPKGDYVGEVGVRLRATSTEECQGVEIIGCMFDVAPSTTSYGLVIEGFDNDVSFTKFEGLPSGAGLGQAIRIEGAGGGGALPSAEQLHLQPLRGVQRRERNWDPRRLHRDRYRNLLQSVHNVHNGRGEFGDADAELPQQELRIDMDVI